jgi:hypothetical protein
MDNLLSDEAQQLVAEATSPRPQRHLLHKPRHVFRHAVHETDGLDDGALGGKRRKSHALAAETEPKKNITPYSKLMVCTYHEHDSVCVLVIQPLFMILLPLRPPEGKLDFLFAARRRGRRQPQNGVQHAAALRARRS